MESNRLMAANKSDVCHNCAGSMSDGVPDTGNDEALFLKEAFGGGFSPAANVELSENAYQMIADGPRRDIHLLRDLFVRKSAGEQFKNI